MTTSPHFKHTSSTIEHQLMKDLTRESIFLKGLDFQYIVRDSAQADSLFGEDTQSTYAASDTIEMYCMNQTGFDGDGDFLARFGLDIRDEATFQVAKERFTDVVTAVHPEVTHPREGDLIYYELANTVLEITFSEHEKPFYQRGIQTTWEMTVKKFEFNHDIMETGIDDIDFIGATPDLSDDSDDIQSESDGFVDFSEDDPFSSNDY